MREWDEFPLAAEAERIELSFDAEINNQEWTLKIRQQDVKQLWHVRINEHDLGPLRQDENDMVVYLAIAPGQVIDGANTLMVEHSGRKTRIADDIRVGEIALTRGPVNETLTESTVDITVIDATTDQPTPARITILDENGALQTVFASSDPQLAVRPGTVFTSTGRARFGLPTGRYTIHAGRGFEYSLATTSLTIPTADPAECVLQIRREVPTEGYVACDTHVHSLTHSGHGDASVHERMVTIAAEGVELPIATDHNIQIDHDPFAREVGVRRYFTPVIGNEVTTPVGHFNIFPVPADAGVPDHRLTAWGEILDEVETVTGAPIVILNHARDLHSGFRPFGPRHFNSAVATNLDGWDYRFNAMEVINSGATQSDALQLFEDWMALLNRGVFVTPVGSSDSHDVARHFVGQGRTYIRCDDRDPGNIDVDAAASSFRQGQVMVSYGLLAEISVDGHHSGELVSVDGDSVSVDVRVLGPHWVRAERVELFANGHKIREHVIATDGDSEEEVTAMRGVQWSGQWTISCPSHDVYLVAIARGPGIEQPFWKTAKPYQPTSTAWRSQVVGCSGALWLDADRDGQRTSAREYAKQSWDSSGGQLPRLLMLLTDYDSAVAAQAAEIYQASGGSFTDTSARQALQTANRTVREGFSQYMQAMRDSQVAIASGTE